MNSLFQQLNPARPLPNNLKQMASMIKGMNNPQMMLSDLAAKNPQLQSVLQMANGNYEVAFNNLAKQMNVNPEEIINLLK